MKADHYRLEVFDAKGMVSFTYALHDLKHAQSNFADQSKISDVYHVALYEMSSKGKPIAAISTYGKLQ